MNALNRRFISLVYGSFSAGGPSIDRLNACPYVPPSYAWARSSVGRATDF